MPAVSKKQQRFFGMVRAAQKGEMENPSSEVLDVASDISMKDAKKFAKTKHKGLPEKKVTKEETKPNPFGKRAILKAMIRSVAERERRKAGVTKEDVNEDRQIKKIVKQLRKSVKSHAKQADTLEKKIEEESNPRIPRKKGQPANSKKHSDLYTDENPKGTIHGLGFKNVDTAKASVSKIRGSSRSHAHKIQAAVAMEQRAKEMGKSSEAAVYRKYINSMKKKTKKMNEDVITNDGKKLINPSKNKLIKKEEVKRDEYGNPIGGPKISKKQLKKNLAKNEPDEQHTTTTSEGVQASYSSTGEVSYGQFYNRAKEARKAMANKSAKQMETKKKSDAIRQDSRKHGIKFSDQKGSGRIIKGKKVYS